MRILFISIISFFILYNISAQNNPDIFKLIPKMDEKTPDWAKLMYSENPNVYLVDDLYEKYYDNNEFIKNIHTQNYKHWRWQIEELIDGNGYIKQLTQEEEEKLHQKLLHRLDIRSKKVNNRTPIPDWECIGPFETYRANNTYPISWHKNIYSIDQSESNPNILICGTEAGGIYRTTDKGLNWYLISKDEVFVGGNGAVKIHPTNTDIHFVASNSRIYRSQNGGSSWIEVYYMNGSGHEFKFDPSNHSIIYCVGSKGLFKSTNDGDSWSQIFSEECWDIDFHPTNSSIVYLLKSNPSAERSELFRSDDEGVNWNLKDNGYYTPEVLIDANERGGKIGVTPASPDMVYVCLIGESKADDNGWIGVYKSTDKGDNWTNPAGQIGGPYGSINGTGPWNVAAYSSGYHQGFFNFDLEVSDTDSDKLWIATIRLTESSDGGATFTSIGAANSDRLSDIHADVQALEVNGDDIWVATDGGINYSDDELMSHESRKSGIQASHFWGFNTGWNQDTYTGGRYHDGTIGWYENFENGTVFNIGGVEEASGYVHPVEGRKMMFRTHYSSEYTSVKIIPENLNDNTITNPSMHIYPNESYYSSASSGIYFDPRYANHLFVGFNNILYKSTNGGVNFEELYTFPAGGKVYEVEQSRKNYDLIYLVFKPDGTSARDIYKSSDGGISFTTITQLPGNRNKVEITLNPSNENEIWVGLGDGANGNKVFKSEDGGNSWINKTTSSLDGENIKDIKFQGGSNDIIYVACYNTVFYFDTNNSSWNEYGNGLPLITKSLKMNPFYRDAELRLGTTGRGVFARKMVDTSFIPIAQPITYNDTVYCENDTVSFDCYSILKHNGATWSWDFTPQPSFINNNSIRNPKVVFGDLGSYDVSLTITDANGNSDTKNIPSMVYVDNRCKPDTIPGKTLRCQDNNDYAQVPNLNLDNIDTLSITAWVKPYGIQNDYTGIVMNDGDATAGFNFANGNNTLQYHWPGGLWWWDSGLIVEADMWSHVAMVATPTAMKLYLNGKEAVHNTSLTPVLLESMKIGSYKGWSSRNFNGEIDEVGIWTRALSNDEIQNFRHLTKEDTINDSNFIAYYQFNESFPNEPIFDKTNVNNSAFLMNGADRINSNAPVGGGLSQRLIINSSGIYDYNTVGLKLGYSSGSTFPNGDVVVSRLNVPPDEEVPNLLPMYRDYYWIINNYGTNSSFTEPDSLWLSDLNFVYDSPPAYYGLHSRSDNDFGETWSYNIDPKEVINGVNSSMLFTGNNGLTESMQLYIVFKIGNEDIIWNGLKWRGGTGTENSPGINDNTKNIHVMPGNEASLLDNANSKSLFIYEDAEFHITPGKNLNTHGN